MTNTEALQIAVDKAGSQSALARDLGKKQGHVWDWLQSGRTPPDICPTIEALYGVRCEDLRDDLDWTRDGSGNITGYHVRLAKAG
jgi:DNA-binding transcriptional regulator YdaS (Cro superfamily)